MTTRRAVSPVIATVILIAVAVALGIAVAVWAGALTSNLQKTEKLVIYAYTQGSPENLTISITNNSPGSSTVTSILFNNVPISGTFVVNGTAGKTLPVTTNSGATSTVGLLVANLGVTPSSGISYPITITTAAGNSYPSTVTWQ